MENSARHRILQTTYIKQCSEQDHDWRRSNHPNNNCRPLWPKSFKAQVTPNVGTLKGHVSVVVTPHLSPSLNWTQDPSRVTHQVYHLKRIEWSLLISRLEKDLRIISLDSDPSWAVFCFKQVIVATAPLVSLHIKIQEYLPQADCSLNFHTVSLIFLNHR